MALWGSMVVNLQGEDQQMSLTSQRAPYVYRAEVSGVCIRVIACIALKRIYISGRRSRCGGGFGIYPPTLEAASVKLFSVVLLPADGLPTRAINGSRAMVQYNLCGFDS